VFTVEKNVSMPEEILPTNTKYPWHEMQVGDSFFVPHLKRNTSMNLRTAIRAANKRLTPKVFVFRLVEGGTRIWRTA
jgi:hypothetical protein